MTGTPRVACIMLVNERPEMALRAITSYRSQTYANRELIVVDTGVEPVYMVLGPEEFCAYTPSLREGNSVGYLRNFANRLSLGASLFAHFDSDDWSHPRRLEEQVELLLASGKEAVGYRDMLFWDTTTTDPFPGKIHPKCEGGPAGLAFVDGVAVACPKCGGSQICEGVFCHPDDRTNRGETWLYDSGHPMRFVGSSMLYTRQAWERSPFHPDEPNEDQIWWMQNQSKCTAMRSMMVGGSEPAMICSIHGANTSEAYAREKRKMPHWLRLENWDAHCAKAMAL